jgi:hypothetical protein
MRATSTAGADQDTESPEGDSKPQKKAQDKSAREWYAAMSLEVEDLQNAFSSYSPQMRSRTVLAAPSPAAAGASDRPGSVRFPFRYQI